ncbi:3-hydroxybutyrate dehydrogenase [Kurthia sibirica]|uniref:3-hydroxybutyrate dehydrogenase n=1 Tax=Kurthia sibirica TaxID=202750 RepID=A0A2U3AMZ3_9BACL|nr:3-hydroxybutyrate dehydrogenase [Kurthia sibirica]PWI25913.1 3-hydroxybutyrate dehydrogenase [Kurthia sibirica]GEK34268.1 3-hydroxybutyrate dehydrogenase [Kurthia sibirica]
MRNILITGAAGGLGSAMVKRFIEAGDFVFAADLNLGAAENLANLYPGKVTAIELDVASSPSVQLAIATITEEHTIHALINNAGVQYRAKIEDFPEEQWDHLQNIMLKGPFLMTKAIFPHMKKQGFGNIVNISSVHGVMATPEKVAYVAAKHGVIGLTRVAALEGAAFGINVNAVLPGPVKTPLLEKQLTDLHDRHGLSEEQALAEIVYPKQAMKRFITSEEIADSVYFLASKYASGITGETISVSGGM